MIDNDWDGRVGESSERCAAWKTPAPVDGPAACHAETVSTSIGSPTAPSA